MEPTVVGRTLCEDSLCGDQASLHSLNSSCYSATTEGLAILLPRLPYSDQLINKYH